jgi:hypothetical protein
MLIEETANEERISNVYSERFAYREERSVSSF